MEFLAKLLSGYTHLSTDSLSYYKKKFLMLAMFLCTAISSFLTGMYYLAHSAFSLLQQIMGYSELNASFITACVLLSQSVLSLYLVNWNISKSNDEPSIKRLAIAFAKGFYRR